MMRVRPLLSRVFSMLSRSACWAFSGSLAISPMARIRISCLWSSGVSEWIADTRRLISASTSSCGRDQFSELKAYTVRKCMPNSTAARSVSRRASCPWMCPSVRGSPRCFAQRPFPSMMIATCSGIRSSGDRSARCEGVVIDTFSFLYYLGYVWGTSPIQIYLYLSYSCSAVGALGYSGVRWTNSRSCRGA